MKFKNYKMINFLIIYKNGNNKCKKDLHKKMLKMHKK